jgi:Beta-propeller repeat
VDASGSAYVAGLRQTTPNFGSSEVWMAKLSPDGTSLLYSTLVGGTLDDEARAIAIDASGSAYVTGQTSSTDFPTVNAYQADQGGPDAFVAKLSPDGAGLVYSTYLGGSASDSG